jgi:hypothetical protein
LVTLALSATAAWAQATAQMNGTVADVSGGILPGATVVAIQTETGFRREVISEGDGSFALLNMPLGPYRLEVSLSGFRTYAQAGIVLQVNSNPVIPVTLQLGSLEETVSVEAAAPLVETRNPSIGAVVDNEQVEAMPLEGRNPVMLVMVAGAAADVGVPTSRSMTTSRGIAITGGQPFAVSYLLDGAMHNNALDGLNWLTVTTGRDNALNGQGNQRVNQLSDDVYGPKSVTQFLDPAAFAQPANGTFGNHVRNSIAGPARWNIDLSVSRILSMAGSQNLELRLEAFNLLNHFNWGVPVTNLGSGTFGRITAQATPPRIIQFGVKYGF